MIAQLILTACLASRSTIHPIRILVDSIHAHNWLKERPDEYSYHYNYGYRKGFAYLRSRGVVVDEAVRGSIDAKRLAGCRMLFINLVSADLPPFKLSEIDAITSFVRSGGGLFVITDHSNCY